MVEFAYLNPLLAAVEGEAQDAGPLAAVIQLIYLGAVVCFILGLKRLSHPLTARSGNILAAVGMFVAIVATLLHREIVSYPLIVIGIVVGSGIGAVFARTVKMTAMPQMVALLNGFGGGASALVAGAAFLRYVNSGEAPTLDVAITMQLSVLIGTVTFSGSLIAFGKLQELMTGRAVTYPLQKPLNAILFAGVLALVVWLVVAPSGWVVFAVLVGAGLLLGVFSVIPIGGADMPVVISLLNSYSGLAAALTGFVINNHGLVISGALVGASGLFLTNIMCKAMNRSLGNVLFGAFGAAPALAPTTQAAAARGVRSYSVEDAAMIFASANSVIIVPGYGMAVAQAQHVVKELTDKLAAHGIDVKFAIHPVAGRMPGHMNVLLAEADVPYEQLLDLEGVNPLFPQTDVALVIGANDVVNPAARHDKASPIYGMPILDVDKARTVMICKRSLNPGFAGIDNELFYAEGTIMLFGDGKATITRLVAALDDFF